MTISQDPFRCGFVGIVGPPNAGKSTLLNNLLGEKIAITSDKPQTTRNRILGVLTRPDAQIAFLDTPGMHSARDLLNRELVANATAVLSDADVILLVLEPGRQDKAQEVSLELVSQARRPVVVAVNKIDAAPRNDVRDLLEMVGQTLPKAALVSVSALTGQNRDVLLDRIAALLPEGPPLFPEDTLTDLPMRFIAAELIREQVFRQTHQEVPYSTAVTVDEYKEGGDVVHISATIHVERDPQKGIIIGKKGERLKSIGIEARRGIEELIETKVFLELFVRVQKNWSEDPRALRDFGYQVPKD